MKSGWVGGGVVREPLTPPYPRPWCCCAVLCVVVSEGGERAEAARSIPSLFTRTPHSLARLLPRSRRTAGASARFARPAFKVGPPAALKSGPRSKAVWPCNGRQLTRSVRFWGGFSRLFWVRPGAVDGGVVRRRGVRRPFKAVWPCNGRQLTLSVRFYICGTQGPSRAAVSRYVFSL